MYEVNDLTKNFIKTTVQNKKKILQEFSAVDHVSFSVEDGKITGLLGPNGAGKTTLLRMLAHIMNPTSGTISFQSPAADQVEEDPALQVKKNIGFLSGNTKLYKRLSTREMLTFAGQLYSLSPETIDARMEELIQVLSLGDFIDNHIENLSTGQTQRASIARCLIHDPALYIFDEPTLGLDVFSAETILDFMKRERERGKTILYSTHYMEEAQYLCDRIIMMHHGRIIADDTPEALLRQTGTDHLRACFFAIIRGVTP